MSGMNDSFNNNICVVCYKNVEIYSIGMCEHPVCYECSTRMRVLCRQNECPICRQDLPKVVFTREIKPFHCLTGASLVANQYDIYFSSSDIQGKFNVLLANTCSVCKERPVFDSFNNLKDHMRQRHALHYCDLCVENLKIFSHERRCYTRVDLAQHRRKGDVDDKSHKGHPLCEFCDQRYMDNDELYRHLRRDHLYCHFCDADGLHQYYSSYDYLRDHFRQEHYLCEEGMCVEEKFTSVFRTDIDLRAHKATIHGKQLSKAAAKQARTLELEFTLAPRGENRMNRRGMLSASTSRNTRDYNGRDYQQGAVASGSLPPAFSGLVGNEPYNESYNEPTFVKQPSVDVQSTDEFPTLGNAAPVIPTLTQTRSRGNVTVRHMLTNHENFPALVPPESSPSVSKMVNFSVSSGTNASGSNMSQSQKGSTSSNVSIQVNHEPNGTVTTRVSGPNIRIRPARFQFHSDFPALGRPESSEPSTSTAANSTQWKEVLQWTCSKSTPMNAPKSKKVTPSLAVSSPPPPIQSGEDFPSLSQSSKSKKQSVITVMPTWGQNSSQSNNNNNNNNAKTMTDLTKGKTKKKKMKQQTLNNINSTGNESNSSKSNANAAAVTKKDVEQSTYTSNSNDFRMSKENSQVTHSANDTSNNTSKNYNVQNSKEQQEHINKKDKRKSKNNADSCDGSDMTLVNREFTRDNVPVHQVQRKRTELKIDSLNTNNNNVHQMEDVSILRSSTSITRPPGFSNPPWFGSVTTPPPPGFSVKYNSIEKLQGSNDLTFTNSSGESYSILPSDDISNHGHAYVSPPDFQKRNASLAARLNEVLVQQEEIDNFRYISSLFRGGFCNAENYYMHCRTVMGAGTFENVFTELLVLLPDIAKQQELFKVYKKQIGGKAKGLEMCARCGQVLKNGSDFRAHMSSHTLENHFPALGKNNTPPPKNTWVRK